MHTAKLKSIGVLLAVLGGASLFWINHGADPNKLFLWSGFFLWFCTSILFQYFFQGKIYYPLMRESLNAPQNLRLHMDLAHSSLIASYIPLLVTFIGWYRDGVAGLKESLLLCCTILIFGQVFHLIHSIAISGFVSSLASPRARLSGVLTQWRAAFNSALLIQLFLYLCTAIVLGKPFGTDWSNLFTISTPLFFGGGACALVAMGISAWNIEGRLKRVLAATICIVFGTMYTLTTFAGAILESAASLSQSQSHWLVIGFGSLIISRILVGPESAMRRPVRAPTLAPADPLVNNLFIIGSLVGLVVVISLYIPFWGDFALIGLMLGYLAWNKARSRQLNKMVSRQTEALRRDKAKVEKLNGLLSESFSKFVPKDIVDDLIKSGEVARLGGEERTVTILFSDIKGYSTIVEELPPERVLQILTRYFSSMEEVVEANGGHILEYIGDAILAVFGAPSDHPEHAKSASICAIEMVKTLERLNEEWEKEGVAEYWQKHGIEKLFSRIGIHKGTVVAGTFGGKRSMKYGVIGDTVNVASRLEAYNKELGTTILISDSVYSELEDTLNEKAQDYGQVNLKGRGAAQQVYSLKT